MREIEEGRPLYAHLLPELAAHPGARSAVIVAVMHANARAARDEAIARERVGERNLSAEEELSARLLASAQRVEALERELAAERALRENREADHAEQLRLIEADIAVAHERSLAERAEAFERGVAAGLEAAIAMLASERSANLRFTAGAVRRAAAVSALGVAERRIRDLDPRAIAAAAREREEMTDQPWPLADAVRRLVEGAEHLLRHHGCDHDHETLSAARDAARSWLAAREREAGPQTCAECEHGRGKLYAVVCGLDGRCTQHGAPVPEWCPMRAREREAGPALFDVWCDGYVHYTRPEGDPLLDEARARPGYEVRPHVPPHARVDREARAEAPHRPGDEWEHRGHDEGAMVQRVMSDGRLVFDEFNRLAGSAWDVSAIEAAGWRRVRCVRHVDAPVCPCEGDDDEPGPHIPTCPFSDPEHGNELPDMGELEADPG